MPAPPPVQEQPVFQPPSYTPPSGETEAEMEDTVAEQQEKEKIVLKKK